MNRRTHEVCASNGTYQHQGQEKKRWVKCGAAFTDDQGRISLKLDSLPVGPAWSGWINLFPVEGAKPADGSSNDQPF